MAGAIAPAFSFWATHAPHRISAACALRQLHLQFTPAWGAQSHFLKWHPASATLETGFRNRRPN